MRMSSMDLIFHILKMSYMDLIFHILKTSCTDLIFPMDTQPKEAASFGTEGMGLEEAAQTL